MRLLRRLSQVTWFELSTSQALLQITNVVWILFHFTASLIICQIQARNQQKKLGLADSELTVHFHSLR